MKLRPIDIVENHILDVVVAQLGYKSASAAAAGLVRSSKRTKTDIVKCPIYKVAKWLKDHRSTIKNYSTANAAIAHIAKETGFSFTTTRNIVLRDHTTPELVAITRPIKPRKNALPTMSLKHPHRKLFPKFLLHRCALNFLRL